MWLNFSSIFLSIKARITASLLYRRPNSQATMGSFNLSLLKAQVNHLIRSTSVGSTFSAFFFNFTSSSRLGIEPPSQPISLACCVVEDDCNAPRFTTARNFPRIFTRISRNFGDSNFSNLMFKKLLLFQFQNFYSRWIQEAQG